MTSLNKNKMLEADTNMINAINLAREAAIGLFGEISELEEKLAAKEQDPDVIKPPEAPIAGESQQLTLTVVPQQDNKGWGDAIFYKNDEPSTLRDQVIVCGGRSGIINAKKEEFKVDWDNLTFTQGQYPTGWGASVGKVVGEIKNCTFVKLGETKATASTTPKDGHSIYAKPNGTLLVEGNKFLSCGGNSQFAARPWEQDMPHDVKVTFRKNLWDNCSWNPTGHGGGGSFNIAFYAGCEEGSEVVVTNNIFHNDVAYPGYEESKSNPSARGVIAIWNEAWYPPEKATIQGFVPDSKYFVESLKFNDNVIRTIQTDRSPIQIKGCKNIEIKNLTLEYIEEVSTEKAFIRIDHDLMNPVRAEKIRIDPIDADGWIDFAGEKHLLRDGLNWDA